VQINTVQGPGREAGGIRIKGTKRGLAMALDGNGRWCWLDPRLGAMHAVAESARKVACTGATPLAATNCLNFGNPEKPQIMWQFAQVIDGMTRACEELEVPITGGNVSFYNETLGEGIYPTPVVGVVGVIEEVEKAASFEFRESGRAVLLLRGTEPGDAIDAEAEFGSSEYAKDILGMVWGFPPGLELEKEAALQRCIVELIRQGLAESAHDCSDGGLAVTLAESAFPKGVGARIELVSNGLAAEFLLFGEDASRILISCAKEHVGRIQELAVEYGVAAEVLGETVSEKIEILVDGRQVAAAGVLDLKQAWATALERALQVETAEELVPAVLDK
jgi:phosphoribosylformylglycinamidine synthase subunit PurL